MSSETPRLNGHPADGEGLARIRTAREAGKLKSASQINTAASCLRAWAHDKVDKVPRKNTPATITGTRCHSALEDYHTTGHLDLTTEYGEIVLPGLKYNPAPGTPHMSLEQHFYFEYRGHMFQGYKDVEIHAPGCVPYVQDHKTTSNFKWAKSQETLAHDVQACLYAADSMVCMQAPRASLNWVYYRTRGARKSKAVHLVMVAQQAIATLDRAAKTADAIDYIRDHGLRPLDLPPSPESCDDYGGCDYQHLCTDIGPRFTFLKDPRK